MLCKKTAYNGLSLELYIPFDFQLRAYSITSSFLILAYQMLADKQTYFEIHHCL